MAEIYSACPGASRLKSPTITEKICPVCGSVIELFSTDVSVACDQCGFIAYNDLQSCIQWCEHAEKCIGTELYNKLVRERNKEEANDTPSDSN